MQLMFAGCDGHIFLVCRKQHTTRQQNIQRSSTANRPCMRSYLRKQNRNTLERCRFWNHSFTPTDDFPNYDYFLLLPIGHRLHWTTLCPSTTRYTCLYWQWNISLARALFGSIPLWIYSTMIRRIISDGAWVVLPFLVIKNQQAQLARRIPKGTKPETWRGLRWSPPCGRWRLEYLGWEERFLDISWP